jgi:hypothetical protein
MRRDLDENDASQDDEITQLSPVQIVRELTMWELGDDSWADSIAFWMIRAGAKPEDF